MPCPPSSPGSNPPPDLTPHVPRDEHGKPLAEIPDKDAFAKWTTNQVCHFAVKPLSASSRESLCTWLQRESARLPDLPLGLSTASPSARAATSSGDTKDQHPLVSQATVFVSHSWQYECRRVVDVLCKQVERGELDRNAYVWFDILTINQHESFGHSRKWAGAFEDALRLIGHTIVVLSPWDDPTPLKRAWCLWEIHCSLVHKLRLEIVMDDVEQRSLRDALVYDMARGEVSPISRMLARVDMKRAEAFKDEDQKMIHGRVEESAGGFDVVNSDIIRLIREWVGTTLLSIACDDDGDDLATRDPLKWRLMLMRVIRTLQTSLGRRTDALTVAKLNVDHCTTWQGPESMVTWVARAEMGIALTHLDRYEDAKTELQSCLEVCQGMYNADPGDCNVVNALMVCHAGLRKVYRMPGRADHQRALLHALCAYVLMSQLFGDDHPETISSLGNMASVLTLVPGDGNLQEAEATLRKVLAWREEHFPEGHEDILWTMSELANNLSKQGRYTEILELREKVCRIRRIKLGVDHPETLSAIGNLALHCSRLRRWDECLRLVEECVECSERVFGPSHDKTIMFKQAYQLVSVQSQEQNTRPDATPAHPSANFVSASPPPDAMACSQCGVLRGRGDYQLCGRCLNARYCNRNCQHHHWRQHKRHCKPAT